MIQSFIRYISIGIVAAVVGLTATTNAAAATRTWDGGSAVNDNWMTAENWEGNLLPAAGDELIFPAGVADNSTNNNFPAGTRFIKIIFQAPYTVNGNRILIASAIEHLGTGHTAVYCDLTLEGGPAATGTITLRVAQASGVLQLFGVINSQITIPVATLRKTGLGSARLNTANTYTGVTAIEEGELGIFDAAALGSAGANTVVSDGAVLSIDVSGSPTIAESLMLAGQGTAAEDDGALRFVQPATMSGAITLFGASTPRIVVASGDVSFSGAIGGAAGFIKSGQGRMRLSGANTYAGMTTVAEGALHLAHAQALGSPSAGTTVLQDGEVDIQVADIFNEPLFAQANAADQPALVCTIPVVCTWNGPIVLQGDNGTAVSAGRTLRLNGDISGSGGLLITWGPGLVEFNGNNTYAGQTVLGNLKLGGPQRIPDTSDVSLGATGILDLNGFPETIGGSLTGGPSTQILLGASTLTIDVANAISSFRGLITGSGGLIKKGSGSFRIRNAQAYTGPTNVQAGVFVLDQPSLLPGPVNVTGGILRGYGSIGALTVSNGRIEPGLGTGIITTKSLSLGAGGTLEIDLVDAGSDQVKVTGPVSVNGATLEVTSDGPLVFDELVIVKNDSPFAVTGTFAGLPEGALVFPEDGRAMRISYVGGDGNDIVLATAEASYYLSEGATGEFFDTDILIANPSEIAAEATLTFLLSDGTTKVETRNVPARSRLTIKVDDIAGLESTTVSTIVTSPSGLPLVVERTMRWDASGYGAHTEKAVTSTSKDWYFAEGSQGFFSTYLLLANPQSSPNTATVRYLRENAAPIVRTYPVAANSRFTVDASTDAELVGSSFGMHVTFEQPGVAERAMYFGLDPFWKAGHESAGVTEPSPTWFLAEGATGPFFETFVLLANPGNQVSEATVTFLPDTGVPVVKTVQVPAQGRVTLNIENEDASLANAAVATQVSATQPILVERAQYWPDPAPQWYEAHNSFGVTAAGTKWGLAEGRSGGPREYQTYILLANPGTVKANVTIIFLREGQAPVEKTFEVNPKSRYNVDTSAVSELAGLNFGAVITSDQPIAVERAMYNNANGQIWAAGTNATATPLP